MIIAWRLVHVATGLEGRIDQKQLYIVRGPHNEDSSDVDDLRTKSPALARGIIKCKKIYSVEIMRNDLQHPVDHTILLFSRIPIKFIGIRFSILTPNIHFHSF